MDKEINTKFVLKCNDEDFLNSPSEIDTPKNIIHTTHLSSPIIRNQIPLYEPFRGTANNSLVSNHNPTDMNKGPINISFTNEMGCNIQERRQYLPCDNTFTPSLQSIKYTGQDDFNCTRHECYCNNCGKHGHNFHSCLIPITSFGIISFRYNLDGEREYLMICRKDTLGFIDFMRGKYVVNNRQYIGNMLNQMTVEEKSDIRTKDFDSLWKRIWGENSMSSQYKSEESMSRNKFKLLSNGITYNSDFYTLQSLIDESDTLNNVWLEPEWGFPKGRRNYQEREYDCAVREMMEETGYPISNVINLKNVLPFDEVFTGSNYKSYKHKYFLTYMNYNISLNMGIFEKTEVSKVEWCSFNRCISVIRHYNKEKIRIISRIEETLSRHSLVFDLIR